MLSSMLNLAIPALVGACWVLATPPAHPWAVPSPPVAASIPERDHRPSLTQDEARWAGAFAAAIFRGDARSPGELPDTFRRTPAIVYLAARQRGDRVAFVWRHATSGAEALRAAARAVAERVGPDQQPEIDTLEINLGYGCERIEPNRDPPPLSNVHRGLKGVELISGGQPHRFAPTEMIALNLSFEKARDRLAERAGIPRTAVGTASAPLRTFEADQLLVELLAPGAATTLLYRGDRLVAPEAVTQTLVRQLAEAQSAWLFANLRPNGRLVYLYWPSRGEESAERNALRLWMASRALGRVAVARGDLSLQERAEQNIRYHLAQFYREDESGHGLIVEDDGDIKLGAIALAALALVEHPRRAEFARQETALRKTIEALWSPSGEFRTFWHPKDRSDNVNFYPGEALLLWATLFAESRDAAMLDRIMTSLRYYRAWHRKNRNPAFIPWHTQAACKVWSVTKTAELSDWIFEMNDWLLGVQQWESQRAFPDTMGRFYDPRRPFGPPHTSSTGVYMEGLVDAWRLASSLGDARRQEAYRRTLLRALRDIAQNTFLDDLDMFYVARKDRVYGGVRTTVYDNTIRVDNVQHNLMAILRLLDSFSANDFQHTSAR